MAEQRVGTDVFREQILSERDSPEIFKGENTGICSFDDFLTHMSEPGKSNGFNFLRVRASEAFKVFWYDSEEGESMKCNFARELAIPWVIVGQSTRIQDRVTSALIFSAQMYSSSAVLLQFWEVINTKSGEKKLKLSEQPFGLGNLYNGLCRYKYHCMLQQEYEDDHGQNGPPARVFKHGLCEDCPNIMQYSTEEFPTRDYAVECSIVSYWALPLFGSGDSQDCVGVLECFSMEYFDFIRHKYPFEHAAKQFGLVFPSPLFHECDKIRRYILFSRVEVEKTLKAVREVHQLPLIQVWVPCLCGDPIQKSFSKAPNKMFCDMRICSENLKFLSELKNSRSKYGTSFVKSGEGLVGRAYSENRPCFFSDTSRLSMSDNPFVLFTRSAGLTACFVIPLKLVHPFLDDVFLEMFLPPEGTCTDANSEAVLKSLWSTLAHEFSKLNVAVGLKQDEEFLAEFVYFLDSEKINFSFFYVTRCSIESLLNDPNAEDTTGSSEQGTDEEPVHLGENMGIPDSDDDSDDDFCSYDDFLTQMSAPGKSNGLTFLRGDHHGFNVFWYETSKGESVVTIGQFTRIQDRVTSALTWSAEMCWSTAVLLQFWAPVKTKTGEIRLTLLNQPFGLSKLYKGLCRYRYHCMQLEYEDDHGQNGPPARVFKRRLREHCPNIIHYSTEEFPTRDYAIECGIVSCWALPLFEPGSSQHCLGVLECFSMESYVFLEHEYPFEYAAKDLGFEFRNHYYHICGKIRRDILCTRSEVEKALIKIVRGGAHQLPLIQVWVPCICGDHKSFSKSSNRLFCNMRIDGLEFGNFRRSFQGPLFLESGEGMVGRAYSENRPCFFSDTSQLSMSDSPFAHLSRSAGLTACFVIPLKLVHPMLDMFLEIFLPPKGTCTNANSEAMLKSLLSTVAHEFSKINLVMGLKHDEDFSVKFSYLDCDKFDLSFFYVKRITIKTCSIEFLPNDPNVEDCTGSSWEVTAQEPVHLDLQNAEATAAEQVNSDELKQYPNAHDTIDSSEEVIATMVEDQITLDVLKPHFGNIIDAAAEALGVSRSTLKRRCRQLGIKRWPWHKRNKVRNIQPNARLKQSQTQGNTTKKKAPHSKFQTKNNTVDRKAAADSGGRIHQNHGMIGKATYLDDTVMFPLKCNFGVEELRRELNLRFLLQADKFKIKYKYKEEWILIICDQDLQLGLDMIKSTGEKIINLSIFPLSTS